MVMDSSCRLLLVPQERVKNVASRRSTRARLMAISFRDRNLGEPEKLPDGSQSCPAPRARVRHGAALTGDRMLLWRRFSRQPRFHFLHRALRRKDSPIGG